MKCFHSFGILLMMLYALPTFGSPSEPTVQTCTVDGLKRTYRLYLPEQLPNDAPLVFVLHGYGGNFNLDQHGLNEAADRHGFAVCYPQGEKDGRGKPCWNVGYPFQADMTIDDVSFLCKLADQLQKKHRLSKKNTFCTGMSNGGEMCLSAGLHPSRRLRRRRPDLGADAGVDLSQIRCSRADSALRDSRHAGPHVGVGG